MLAPGRDASNSNDSEVAKDCIGHMLCKVVYLVFGSALMSISHLV